MTIGMKRRRRGTLVLLASLLAPMGLGAGLNEEFETLRIRYAEDLAAIQRPLKKHFVLRLQTLEKEYLAAGRYEEVMAAREIMRAYREAVGEEAWALPLELVFVPEEAERKAVLLEGGFLSAWESQGAEATWRLPGLPAGGYEVWLEHTPVEEGVEVRLAEARYFVQTALPEGTPDDGYQRSLMGNLKITQGSGRLSLSIGAGADQAVSLRIKALQLIAHAP